jgi:hypothetical protein
VNEAGKRVFNVSINDELVFGSVDIFNEAGGGFKALSKTATVVVTENSMAIKFIHVIENPKVRTCTCHDTFKERLLTSSTLLITANID